jgi:hypothetical protein
MKDLPVFLPVFDVREKKNCVKNASFFVAGNMSIAIP